MKGNLGIFLFLPDPIWWSFFLYIFSKKNQNASLPLKQTYFRDDAPRFDDVLTDDSISFR